MENVLAVVACGPRLELALASAGSPAPGVVALAAATPRNELIVAALDLLLRAAGVPIEHLEAVAATRGPGSFTGVRVGLATAQGLATALGIPGLGAPSLLVQAGRCREEAVLAVQPARRGFAYAQKHERRGDVWLPRGGPEIVALADLAAAGLPVVAADGLELGADVPRATTRSSAAVALLELAAHLDAGDQHALTPIYLEPPPAVPPARTVKPWPPSPRVS